MRKYLGAIAVMSILASAQSGLSQEAAAPDLMAFANGALPVAIDTGAANLRVDAGDAVAIIDGNHNGFVAMRKPASESDVVEFTYELPALTQFTRFAVPNVLEIRSPSQSFFREIEVLGSAASAQGPFVPLASATLTTHEDKGQLSELAMAPNAPEVQWVKLRLQGAILAERDRMFLEFSELIGNGTQREAALSGAFDGIWAGRGVKLELAQEGASVTGCYDGNATLNGTVQGKVLRALGANDAGIQSQFILIPAPDGAIRGLRSTNGAPFKPYDGDASDKAPKCLPQEAPVLGCGSIVHGIGFDYDSDTIRPSSQVVIKELFEGLKAQQAVQIIGHSSSEGAADYNRDLSQRRAQSVVAALVALGLNPSEISAHGRGEDEPIARNDNEAGRSMNRRVEIQCAG